jgi:hypothetical protein
MAQFQLLQIMNAALVSCGLDEIASEDDGTPEFRLLSRNWPLIVESELETGKYEFTRVEVALASRIAGKFGFDDGYVLPVAALAVRNVWTVDNGVRLFQSDWGQDGTTVYVNEDSGISVEYVESADPSLWSATFASGVSLKLQAIIMRALQGEPTAAARLEQDAMHQFQQAQALATQQRAARPPIRYSSFAEARFQRG